MLDLLADYEKFEVEYLDREENSRPDFNDKDQFKNCNNGGESVFKPYDEWFGAEVTGCDFKIQLQSQYFYDAGYDDRATQSKYRQNGENVTITSNAILQRRN